MTLDEAFDLVKELNEIWAAAGKVVRFYTSYTQICRLFKITLLQCVHGELQDYGGNQEVGGRASNSGADMR